MNVVTPPFLLIGLMFLLLPLDKRCSPANPSVTSHDIHQT